MSQYIAEKLADFVELLAVHGCCVDSEKRGRIYLLPIYLLRLPIK